MSGWQNIETAPKDGTTILAWVYCSKYATVRWINGYWTIYHMNDRKWLRWLRGPEKWLALSVQPTHWMPLPSPPSTIDRRTE